MAIVIIHYSSYDCRIVQLSDVFSSVSAPLPSGPALWPSQVWDCSSGRAFLSTASRWLSDGERLILIERLYLESEREGRIEKREKHILVRGNFTLLYESTILLNHERGHFLSF